MKNRVLMVVTALVLSGLALGSLQIAAQPAGGKHPHRHHAKK